MHYFGAKAALQQARTRKLPPGKSLARRPPKSSGTGQSDAAGTGTSRPVAAASTRAFRIRTGCSRDETGSGGTPCRTPAQTPGTPGPVDAGDIDGADHDLLRAVQCSVEPADLGKVHTHRKIGILENGDHIAAVTSAFILRRSGPKTVVRISAVWPP